jgi:putative ABC transport system ATP-binding protein
MFDVTANVLEVSSLRKSFFYNGVETFALNGIDLSVRRGEYLAISGPSGSGKSTLLGILGLMDTPSSGVYLFNGHDVAALSNRERTKIRNQEIGFIFQAFNLIDDLTVQENVELPLTYRDGASSKLCRRQAIESLERVGLLAKLRHYPSDLSGGQQQRVAVARALSISPSLLLADEPTGNLDSISGASVMDLLSKLNHEGTTICLVTHNPHFAARAQRVVNVEDGRIREVQPTNHPQKLNADCR